MITVSDAVKNIFKKEYSVVVSTGGTIEYNLNNMVDKITATSSGADHSLSNAFKNLFPIDSIYSSYRPLKPGIKYYIYTSETSPGIQTDTPPNSFEAPRSIGTPTKPRLYYPGPDTTYKYWLGPKNADINISLEYFNNETTPGVKLTPCNKIIARFETSHDTPTSWTIKGTKSDNTEVTLATGSSINSNGEAIAYYNGTEWSTTEPSKYTSTQSFKKISLSAVNSNTGKFLAVLELSPRWVIDISDDIQDFEISKETTINDDSILPVGTLSSNLLSLNIAKFDESNNILQEYNRDSEIDSSVMYLDKNAIISPYIVVNDGSSDVKIQQGKYYMVEWSLSEFGSSSIRALDSSKILQDTIAPLILVQDMPATAIIRRVLDSIGYSNYNINIAQNDKSIPVVRYFWTKDGQTVWECLQDLCRDMQINMFVDNNDIMQIYSRDAIYDSQRTKDWIFTNEEISSNGSVSYIPNIISLNKKEKVAGNSVKVLWSAPGVSGYVANNAAPVWISSEDGLAAGTLATNLNETETGYININLQSVDQLIDSDLIIPDFSGFLLIDTEVIEYEGLEFEYYKASDSTKQTVLITNASDFWKHYSLAKTDAQNINTFKASGRYKIKKRAALGTSAKSHNGNGNATVSVYGPIDLTAPGDVAFKGDLNQIYSSAKDAWNAKSSKIGKSFYPVTNFDKSKSHYTSGVIAFDSITTSSKPGFYSIGTRMFFDNQFDTGLKDSYSTDQVGGFTVFAGDNGKKGYHVIVSTTAGSRSSKDIRILKTTANGLTTVLKDSQTNAISTFAGVYAAQSYNVDVLVKSTYGTGGSLVKNTLTIFINGFRIDAEDTASPLSPSNKVGLLCGQGIVYYDYVYGLNIPEKSNLTDIDYTSLNSKGSYKYNGVYSDDTISMLFGDLVYSSGETRDSRNGSLKEFGSVVRQIKRIKVRYDSANPAIPLYLSSGVNKNVNIMSSKLQPFTAEMLVMNNTSGFVNLADGQYNTFQVVGTPIVDGGVVEYSTDSPDSRAKKYPVQFDSTWIQSATDAKSLADWITSTQLNKGQSVEMEVFGNPLINPGDIIGINYPLQDLSVSNKTYIVTSVRLGFSQGVNTNIVCRAI
jgi:hypothetical protein